MYVFRVDYMELLVLHNYQCILQTDQILEIIEMEKPPTQKSGVGICCNSESHFSRIMKGH